MDRRQFLQRLTTFGALSSGGSAGLGWAAHRFEPDFGVPSLFERCDEVLPEPPVLLQEPPRTDVVAGEGELRLIRSLADKLAALQSYVGYGKFNILSLDQALAYGRYQSRMRLSEQELGWVEDLFAHDAARFGFFGEKVSQNLSERVIPSRIEKVAGTGHYLFRGRAQQLYDQICREVGDRVVLTSGIRSHMKQLYLFVSQVLIEQGNFSAAAHKLAPPGYTFHGVGDFDVGKRGFGLRNFSEEFAQTDIYRRLVDSGYVAIRYPAGNPFGVRFEPWHIKVVS